MIRLSHATAVALAALAAGAAFAAPPKPAPDVRGVWVGRYECGQGITALTLEVAGQPGQLTATFRFGPVKENPGVPKGVYAMTGAYDAKSGKVKLAGEKWITQPDGYFMVDLTGRVAPDGSRLAGEVPAAGCTRFELFRTAPLIS